ncbi:MAG: phosphate ABC transporter permease PstA [Alphaproteobacteria bacterium]|nr:phosphate ABC transporter permease PstA [Alphaproteobacteria bacterium]
MSGPSDSERIAISEIVARGIRRRRAAEARFKTYGAIAILIAIAFLLTLFATIFSNGISAFTQTHIRLELALDPALIDPDGTRDPEKLKSGNYRKIIETALFSRLNVDAKSPDARLARLMLSDFSHYELRDRVVGNPDLVGTTESVWLPAHSNIDQYIKGAIKKETPNERRLVKDQQIAWADELAAAGDLKRTFNRYLFTRGASSKPELAGLEVALIGSFWMMLIVLVFAVPIGVSAAVYLEEFAKKNSLNDIIEVNINNLAAVPSIVFGILGLAVFVNTIGLPRSTPVVGGLVLTLMTLPTIIIATRAALKAVPPSIREAALGVGASKMQSIFHHVLPLSAPAVLTGTIIGLAQALGETAPLLIVGLFAFVVQAPATPFDSSSALPVQIYLWATYQERGFVERTSAGIIVLLAFMIGMNLLAIILRSRFERRW